ncbi:MAG: SRPBCC family protein [Elusimicrobiota bacterium]|nr:SRPBCC family protein [Elusimicrobiota bacterium]
MLNATFAALLVLLCAPASAGEVELSLREYSGRMYEVDARFDVSASSAVVWEVLTDYENLPSFVSSMRKSRVLETREDGVVVVEQDAVGGFLFLDRQVSVCLDVKRALDRLNFIDTCRRDFWFYEGGWATTDTLDGGTRVSYRLQAQPDFVAPGFIVKRVMNKGARELLVQVREEILRRAARR